LSEVSKRDNQGKPQLSFILQFPTAIAAHARVKELGAIKYERDNWKKGGKPDHEYLDACLRHISAFMEGETFADDTGCTHLAHAMWNIMALQDLNYKGVTHDPELFASMCEYWKNRRFAESKGQTFPSVEVWTERNQGTLWIEPAAEMMDEPDDATRAAAARLFDKVVDPPPMRTFEMLGPGLAETFLFEQPLTVKNGESLNFDLNARTATVTDESGEVLATTGLTVEETSSFVTSTPDPDEPIDANMRNLWPRIDMDLPAERFEPLPGSGVFTLQEASEQLSAVMGTSVEASMSAIQSAMSPLDSLFAGHVTTTLEDGELIGKTNRSVEDLRAEAEANIAKHTELNAKEAAMEKKIIASRSFQRLIQEREQASYRKGYEAAQEDYRLPDVGQCDDPDCRCNA